MPTLAQPLHLLSAAAAWPVTSQHRSRRNALAGSAALARLRLERLEVEDYLAEHAARRPRPPERPRRHRSA